MPVLPEFIPLAKQKMFAVSSWRDSPQTTPALTSVPATQAEKENAAQGKGHRSRRSRGRGKAQSAQQPDVDNFFVNCVLPSGVGFADLEAELQRHATTPLRVFDIGTPQVLSQRRNGAAAADDAPATTTAAAAAAVPLSVASGVMGRPPVELTPFRTPVVVSAGGPMDDGDDFPGAPLPALALPPSVPSEVLQKGHLISLLFAENGEATKVSELLSKKWPQATVMVVSRNRAVLNASLVLKSLPSLTKTERIIEELERAMPHKPSYIRLHRGERGVFKNVIFVKYPNREIAEESKLRLERFVIGSRVLKVEFKKKEKGTAEREKEMTLQQLVRELRVSPENEGFYYRRAELTKDDIKTLKQLCYSYKLSFELSEESVTVRRILSVSGRPSPALRPALAAGANVTPTAPTPGSMRPIDFKGIRHWKDIRTVGLTLGIFRPKGPDDVASFAPGRGRPI